MKVDISALLGGDIYAKLRERSADAKTRFSKERSADQALADHGLVKVRFTDHKSERKELSASLATRAGARLVLQVGHTATLYRTPLAPPAAV
jgi:hypothetical protein